jgi:hypothetical protein
LTSRDRIDHLNRTSPTRRRNDGADPGAAPARRTTLEPPRPLACRWAYLAAHRISIAIPCRSHQQHNHTGKGRAGGRPPVFDANTAATSEETKGRVLTAAENDFAVVLLGAADNCEENGVVLNLLTLYDPDSSGFGGGLTDYTVTG